MKLDREQFEKEVIKIATQYKLAPKTAQIFLEKLASKELEKCDTHREIRDTGKEIKKIIKNLVKNKSN